MFMELMMQECQLQYLDGSYIQQIPVEQTAELIVPDKCADAEEILDTFGTLIVKENRYEGEVFRLSGSVQAGVLLLTCDGQPERVETTIPFTMERQILGEGQRGDMQFQCSLSSVDGKILNSRKLLLRANISCRIQLLEEQERTLHSLEEPGENLQLRTVEYPTKLAVEQGSKSFTLSEEPELPELAAPVARILKTVCCPRVLEQKAVGGKGVFKMEILLHILYADPEDRMCSYEWRIPVSQYVDFSHDVEGGQLHTTIQLTDLDLEPDSRVQSRRLFFRVGLLAQCVVYEIRRISVIEDAFCTDAVLQPKWQNWQCRSLLDSREMSTEARWRTEEGISSVVDVWAQPMEPELQRQGDSVNIKLPVNCSLVYYDTKGQLRGRSIQAVGETELPLHASANVMLRGLCCGQVFANAGPAGAELRIPIQFRADSFVTQLIRDLEEAEIRELPASGERKPALILRRIHREESLWDIAKSYSAPVEGIRSANELDQDSVPENTMLLIPL